MADRKFTLPAVAPPPSAAALATMDALTEAQITAAAKADPDNPPLTERELMLVATQRLVRAARTATGLSQEGFASAFGLTLGRVRDLEQGRTAADPATRFFLDRIAHDARAVQEELVEIYRRLGQALHLTGLG